MNQLGRVKFSIVGLALRSGADIYEEIGEALFCFEEGALNEKSKFMLTLKRGPLRYYKTFLVPEGSAVLDTAYESIFRVCGSMNHCDGSKTNYGLGSLMPVRGSLRSDTYYFELVPDFAQAVWHSGKFMAHLDPFELDNYATLSNAA